MAARRNSSWAPFGLAQSQAFPLQNPFEMREHHQNRFPACRDTESAGGDYREAGFFNTITAKVATPPVVPGKCPNRVFSVESSAAKSPCQTARHISSNVLTIGVVPFGVGHENMHNFAPDHLARHQRSTGVSKPPMPQDYARRMSHCSFASVCRVVGKTWDDPLKWFMLAA